MDASSELSSEGFSTADFYIDESLPSSITAGSVDSPSYRKIQELQAALSDRVGQLDSRERELASSRADLEEVRASTHWIVVHLEPL